MSWILTVSPVPLVATATNQHVLLASVAAKSILRSVVEELYLQYDHFEYFPSYEIASYFANRGTFIEADLRTVSAAGVTLVMRAFQESFVLKEELIGRGQRAQDAITVEQIGTLERRIEAASRAESDEVFNDPV